MFTMLKFCKVKLSWCLSFDFRWKTELAVLDICVIRFCMFVFFPVMEVENYCVVKQPLVNTVVNTGCQHSGYRTHHIRTLHSSHVRKKTAIGSQCHLVVFWLRNDLITFPEWIYGGLIKAFRPTASRHWSRLLFAKCITLIFAMM